VTVAELTGDQQAAVAGRGTTFVSAGAGTGKTTVLVERVALAVEGGLDPERILVVTYTERAAQQLMSRVRSRLAAVDDNLGRLAERVEISTIHGFCARLLRQHAFAAGIDPEFRVLEEASASILASEAFERALRAAVDEQPDEALDLLAAYGGDKLRGMLAKVHGQLRSAGLSLAPELPPPASLEDAMEEAREGIRLVEEHYRGDDSDPARRAREATYRLQVLLDAPPDDPVFLVDLSDAKLPDRRVALKDYDDARKALEAAALDQVAARQHRRLTDLLHRFDTAYQQLKDAEGALDFEDLELRARDLLRDDQRVREATRERFRHVLVDEFQDTNRLQCELIDLVCAPDAETFFVGDEFQSIYRFRHADVQVFIDRRSLAAAHIALRDNYRSRPEVLQFVNDLFGRVFGDEYRALEASRRFEGAAFEYPVELLVVDRSEAGGAAEWRAAEAELIAERVAAVLEDGEHEPGDVVVLLRSGTDVETYEEALRAKGLETHRAIGRGYYGRQQVIDLCAYLRLIRNRYDDHALLTVLASPLVGVSNDGLYRIRRSAKYSLYGALERTLPPGLEQRDQNLLRAFRQRFDRTVALSAEVGLEELCERIVSDHDYDLACLAQPDGKRRYANVRKLVRLAREYESLRGPDLPGFLHFVDAQAGAEARESEAAIAEEEGGDAVRLMTIHSAKGLEFPVVVVADCGRRAPSAREEIIALPEGSFGFRVPDATGKLRDPTAYQNVLQAEKEASLQEQRRVLYVAMTRAADRLLVSGAWAAGSKDTSPLGWIIEGLQIDPGQVAADEPEVRELDSGTRVLVHVRRPRADSDEQPVEVLAPPPAEPEEQLALFGAEPASEPPRVPEPVAVLPALPPLPIPPAHVPRRLSFSAIALHERCAYRYYAERALGLSPVRRPPPLEEGEPQMSALDIGDAVHRLLETGGQADLTGRYPRDPTEEERARIDALVARFTASALAARMEQLHDVTRERGFTFVEDGVIFRGFIDLCGREPDGTFLIVDYKTHVLGEADPAEIVAADYRIQQVTYALAGLRAGAPAAEVAFVFLDREDAIVTERFTDEAALAAELRAAMDRLRTSAFEPRPSDWACADCGALDRICAGPRLGLGTYE
jgi:ATP-dependent helicase/nuclease subunit A